MDWLNYHHLFYFWTVVREGSVTAACKRLGLAQPTVSGQLNTLAKSLGQPLFTKSGRKIVLTDFGRMVEQYADEIFTTGRELMDSVRHGRIDRPMRFVVGITDVIPKLVASAILEPVMELEPSVQLVVQEGKASDLLAELALYHIDLLISDAPIAKSSGVRAYNHHLGESAMAIYGSSKLARRYSGNFPQSLDGAPMLLPTANTTMRPALDRWFEREGVSPLTVGEFEDAALLKVFGQKGHGLFASPLVIAEQIEQKYRVKQVGLADGVSEQFYAISLERRITHPGVSAIFEHSRGRLFATQQKEA